MHKIAEINSSSGIEVPKLTSVLPDVGEETLRKATCSETDAETLNRMQVCVLAFCSLRLYTDIVRETLSQ